MPRREATVFALTVLILVFGFVFGFTSYPLLEPDEGRNAEVAREMAITNDYVLPRLNGLPYLDKPVLFFAAGALAMEVLGPTELAARLPSLLFTLGTLLLVWWFGRRHFDADTAITAVIASAATPFALAYSRTVIFDSTLTFFMVAAILALFEAMEDPDRDRATWWRAGAWAAIAFGVLTKGPIAIAIPLLVCLPYAIWRRRARHLFDVVSGLLFVALTLPWVFAISQEIPNFLEYVLVTETLSRVSSDELGRAEPWWYFLAILPAAGLPWSLVAARNIGALRDKLRTPDARYVWFFLSWLVVPFVFFSLSTSKRPQYMLPLLPALAFLCAIAWRGRDRLGGTREVGVGLGVIGLFLLAAHSRIEDWVSATTAVAPIIAPTAIALGVVCGLSSAIVLFGAGRRSVVLLGLALPIAAIPVVGSSLMQAIGSDRSARDLAAAIDGVAGKDAQVVTIEAFPHSLPFYLRRPVVVVTDDGVELTSNYLIRHFEAWNDSPNIRPRGWWRDALLECRRPRVFVTRIDNELVRDELDASLETIAVTRKYVAYGPCGVRQLALSR